MQNITSHVCHHTYCSNMVKSGRSPETFQYLMVYSDIKMTLNIYMHLGLEDATDKLGLMEKLKNVRKEKNKD